MIRNHKVNWLFGLVLGLTLSFWACEDKGGKAGKRKQSCLDFDKDGYGLLCEKGSDCDDSNPNVWKNCGSCQDKDKDDWYAGCDQYLTIRGPDCNDQDLNNWLYCASCLDEDGDHFYFVCDSYQTISGPDCNDQDANNWLACQTCRDRDEDEHYIDCDAYLTISGPDCDDLDSNNWESCSWCRDEDQDQWYLNCDDYQTILGPDCNDADPNNWESCGSCQDADLDGWYSGCDLYQGILGPDCDDFNFNVWKKCSSCKDRDGDGWFGECDQYLKIEGPDCDDNNKTIYPGALEVYGDQIDQDCDGREPDQFVIDPHLQLGNQLSAGELKDRITVCWETASPSPGMVLYGTTFPPSHSVVESASKIRHEINLVGLLPDTRYFYQVFAGNSVGPVASFKTASMDLHQPFRFAYIADTRTQHSLHQAVIDLTRSWNPAFFLHGGDMVEWGWEKSQWLTYFRIERPLLQFSPIAPVIGNHDLNLYQDHFSVPMNLDPNEWFFSWDYGNIHFIHTSTENPSPAQDAILFADLAQASANYPNPRFIVVVMHRNAYSNAGHWGNENYPYSTIWGPQFEQARVALVLQAHAHCYERFEPIDNRTPLGDPPGEPDVITQGVIYVTAGGGGAPLHHPPPPPGYGGNGTPPLKTLVAEATYESMLIEVSGGKMHLRVFRLDHSLLDEFYLIRNYPPSAKAGPDFSAQVGNLVLLDGSASNDPENDPLSYQWSQLSGPLVILNNANTATPSFTPDAVGTYSFELKVDDGIYSAVDTLTITITN